MAANLGVGVLPSLLYVLSRLFHAVDDLWKNNYPLLDLSSSQWQLLPDSRWVPAAEYSSRLFGCNSHPPWWVRLVIFNWRIIIACLIAKTKAIQAFTHCWCGSAGIINSNLEQLLHWSHFFFLCSIVVSSIAWAETIAAFFIIIIIIVGNHGKEVIVLCNLKAMCV